MVGAAVNAPIRASDCIGELCIALAYRWESERLFVIFTAYFDEADTHGAAPTVILAAFLGHAFEWRRFEQKLAKLQPASREGVCGCPSVDGSRLAGRAETRAHSGVPWPQQFKISVYSVGCNPGTAMIGARKGHDHW
jgi:hypothetical protein